MKMQQTIHFYFYFGIFSKFDSKKKVVEWDNNTLGI